jgi:pectin methylesterase-like acyl-CoA thioesterase
MQAKSFSAFVAVTTFVIIGHAEAATYYVSPKGDDVNRGTSLKAPLRTIQQAINAARPGDTILVRGGIYRETVSTPRSGTSRARISIKNYNDEVVTVSGTDPVADYWTPLANGVYRAPMPWNYHFDSFDLDLISFGDF